MRAVTPVVILAAGGSRRLGRPKQMELLGNETLLGRATRVAGEAGLGAAYVVVDETDPVLTEAAKRLRCKVVLNGEAAEGMAASIRAGVLAVTAAGDKVTGLVMMTCDQPAVTSEHLRRLSSGEVGEVVASMYAGRRGVPAYLPERVFRELMELRGDVGARDLLRAARGIELAGGDLDVDTAEDLARARVLFGDGPA